MIYNLLNSIVSKIDISRKDEISIIVSILGSLFTSITIIITLAIFSYNSYITNTNRSKDKIYSLGKIFFDYHYDSYTLIAERLAEIDWKKLEISNNSPKLISPKPNRGMDHILIETNMYYNRLYWHLYVYEHVKILIHKYIDYIPYIDNIESRKAAYNNINILIGVLDDIKRAINIKLLNRNQYIKTHTYQGRSKAYKGILAAEDISIAVGNYLLYGHRYINIAINKILYMSESIDAHISSNIP